jgi:hypothetical protein
VLGVGDGGGGVGGDDHLVASHVGFAGGALDAAVGQRAGDDQHGDAESLQGVRQRADGTGEGTVSILIEHEIAVGHVHLGIESVSRRAGG